jgi:hypothetical protein
MVEEAHPLPPGVQRTGVWQNEALRVGARYLVTSQARLQRRYTPW